jgi:hypothetical protein
MDALLYICFLSGVVGFITLYFEDLKDYIRAKRIVSKKQATISHKDLKRDLGI